MNNLITKSFNQNEITVINKDNEAWFLADEVAQVLQYRDAHNLTRLLDDDETSTHIMSRTSNGGNPNVKIINESGLYHALFKSRKKEAIAFRKWVTNEILPSIRKTGKYESEALQQKLDDANTKIKQLESENEKVTPAMKAHMHKLVKVHVNKTKRSHSSVWHEANRYAGASKIDDVLKENYPLFCQFFNAEPIEGEFIPKQKENYALLQEKIQAALAMFPEYTSRTMAFDSMTRTNAIFRVLNELGINVESAKNEQRFLWRQVDQWSHLADHISNCVKNFKVELSGFSQNLSQAISYSSNIEDKWKVA